MRRVRRRVFGAGRVFWVVSAAFLLGASSASADGTVDVTLSGAGAGKVTSVSQETNGFGTSVASPGQIDCATGAAAPHDVCSVGFDFDLFGFSDDGFVTLTATPDEGDLFDGWAQSGASSSARCTTPPAGDPTCRVDLNGTPGPGVTVTATFVPGPDPPAVTTDAPTAEGDSTATMAGSVNPGGTPVGKCYFEYGTTTDYGTSVPCEPSAAALGSGNAGVAVSAVTRPLESGTTYHYRLVASNIGGTSEGSDRTFATTGSPGCGNASIRFAQGIATTLLPDCMALELVSPPKKFVQNATNASVSADGGRVIFKTRGALGDVPSQTDLAFGDTYVATRGTTGWSVEGTVPPAPKFDEGWSGGADLARSFSPDFASWLMVAGTKEHESLGLAQVFRGGLGGLFLPLSPFLEFADAASHGLDNLTNMQLQGAAADHSRMVFAAGESTTRYLADDPNLADAGGELGNVYVTRRDQAGGTSLELLARDGAGTVWGARCGVRLGGLVSNLAGASNGRDQGAVSYPDGSRSYFSTRPAQAGSDPCNPFFNRLRIMRRVDASGGPQVTELLAGEPGCARVSPACDPGDGDDLYQGASVDGSKVYFTTTRQLTDSDLDVGNPFIPCDSSLMPVADGCDLYLYDSDRPAGDRLIQVSAGTANPGHPTAGSDAKVYSGTTAISGDGSHVYFVAQGVLTADTNPAAAAAVAGQPNLYLYQRDDSHPAGQLAFIGTLAVGDSGQLWGGDGTFKNGAYPVPATGNDDNGVEIGGDGRTLLFQSRAALTAGDSDGGRLDVYRYDSVTDQLERISKAAPGGSDNGAIDVLKVIGASQTGTDFAESYRWASEDGETVVFKTREGLAADDDNAAFDSYMWRDGQLHRLPGSADSTALAEQDGPSRQPAVSHDGSVVAFAAVDPLLPQDGDTAIDVYTARVDGGYVYQPDPADCDVLADACHDGGSSETPFTLGSGGPDDSGPGLGERGRLSVKRLTARQRSALGAGRRIRLAIVVNQAGTVTVTGRARLAKRVRKISSATRRTRRPGAVRVPVELSRGARRQLVRTGRLAVKLTVTFSAARKPATTNLVLRQTAPKAKRGGTR
jgi:hypothetical protein